MTISAQSLGLLMALEKQGGLKDWLAKRFINRATSGVQSLEAAMPALAAKAPRVEQAAAQAAGIPKAAPIPPSHPIPSVDIPRKLETEYGPGSPLLNQLLERIGQGTYSASYHIPGVQQWLRRVVGNKDAARNIGAGALGLGLGAAANIYGSPEYPPIPGEMGY